MTDASIHLRAIVAEDRPDWEPLWRDYLRYYETELPAKVYDVTFSRLLSDDPHSLCGLAAIRGEQMVGIVHYFFHAHSWKPEGICYLQDLFTIPEVRRSGVGRALIEGVYAAADARGVPSVYWTTQNFNAAGRALYDKVGELTPFIKYIRPT